MGYGTYIDVIFDWEEALDIVRKNGIEGFMEKMDSEYGYRFFSCSEHWQHDPKFICKMKGAQGDLIIGWKGVHV